MRKSAILIRLYYECSKINFSEDVLDILRITPERRIQKPGKDKSMRVLGLCISEITENETLLEEKMNRKERLYNRRQAFMKQCNTEVIFKNKTFNRELNRNRVTK